MIDDRVEAMVNRALAPPKVYCRDCQWLRWDGLTLERATTLLCGHPGALVTRDTSFTPEPQRMPLEVRNAHNDCPDFAQHDGVSRRALPRHMDFLLLFFTMLVIAAGLSSFTHWLGWW